MPFGTFTRKRNISKSSIYSTVRSQKNSNVTSDGKQQRLVLEEWQVAQTFQTYAWSSSLCFGKAQKCQGQWIPATQLGQVSWIVIWRQAWTNSTIIMAERFYQKWTGGSIYYLVMMKRLSVWRFRSIHFGETKFVLLLSMTNANFYSLPGMSFTSKYTQILPLHLIGNPD